MQQETNKALQALHQKGTILYPTDTIWGLGCDATNSTAVAKVYALKKRASSKSFIILVSDLEMLKKYTSSIPEKVIELVKHSKKPLSIVFNKPKGLAENVLAENGSVAIRICKDPFCKALIAQFNKPIVATSANISGMETPKIYAEINPELIEKVDYAVQLHLEKKLETPSQIIEILPNGEIKYLRN